MRRSISFAEPKMVYAGNPSPVKFTFSPATSLPKGTRLKFDIDSKGRDIDWEVPQASPKAKNNLIFLSTPKTPKAFPKLIKGSNPIVPSFEFILSEEIAAGDEISINLTSGTSGLAAKAQHHVQRRKPFYLYVDTKGKGDYKDPEVFSLDIKGNELDHIRVIAPSLVNKNERFDIVVRFEDRYGNLTSSAEEGTLIELSYDQLRENLNWKLFVPETGFINLPNLYFNEPGIYRIKLHDSHSKNTFYSSPIKCIESDQPKSIFWGSFHGESQRFDSFSQIESCLRYFRDDQAYHFFSTSPFENEEETSSDIWKQIAGHISEFNEEDRFISYLGFQWFNGTPSEGLRQLVYLKDNKPLQRKKDIKSSNLKKIYKSHSTKELFSIPSFTMAGGMHYDFSEFNPEYEPVVEIYNAWGSSECTKKEGNLKPIESKAKSGIKEAKEGSIRAALNKNLRFGFVAGGLDDRGIFSDFYDSDQVQYTPGITAIISPKHTRDDLIHALRERSCYATTGARMIIGLDVAGKPMGSILSTKTKPGLIFNRYITGYVIGTDNIEKVEIIRNGQVVKSYTPNETSFEFEFDEMEPLQNNLLTDPQTKSKFTYYYMRAIQKDSHIAWSSPIWVDLAEAGSDKKK